MHRRILADRIAVVSTAGVTGAEGAVIDPVTSDFLFSTFGGGNQVIVVQGFAIPVGETPTPTPTELAATATPTATAQPTATMTPTFAAVSAVFRRYPFRCSACWVCCSREPRSG